MVPFRANVEFQTVVVMIIKIFQRVDWLLMIAMYKPKPTRANQTA